MDNQNIFSDDDSRTQKDLFMLESYRSNLYSGNMRENWNPFYTDNKDEVLNRPDPFTFQENRTANDQQMYEKSACNVKENYNTSEVGVYGTNEENRTEHDKKMLEKSACRLFSNS